jgi:hypothetical protein
VATAGPLEEDFYHPYAASLRTISERSEDGESRMSLLKHTKADLTTAGYQQREQQREWRASRSDRPDSGVFSPVCLRPLSDCSSVSALTTPP